MSRFEIVVAADEELGIGKDGAIPWRLPGDMAHFVRVTRDTRDPGARNAVLMGRKTWESIPPRFRPLSGRLNVVLSRTPDLDLGEEVEVAGSLRDGLRLAEARAERIFVIGGGEIYRQALELPGCAGIWFTRILSSFGCDTFFPDFAGRFAREEVVAEAAEGGLSYRIERWTPTA
jgi:dihydrofolate reductase